MEITDKEKHYYLLSHGWEAYGSQSYVKTEWLNDPRGHLSPNWYRSESLDSAYDIEMDIVEKESWLLNNGWEKSGNGFVKSKWIDKNNPMELENAYSAAMAELNEGRRYY